MTALSFNKPLHGLRGVAAVGVFSAHSLAGYTRHLCVDCNNEWTGRAVALGTFGVEIFFLLSGFVIFSAATRSTPSAFLKSRFWRVYPVFLFFTLLFFVLNRYLQVEPNKDHWYYLLINALFLDLIVGSPALTPNAWTITFEVYFYLLTFAIVDPLVRQKNVLVLSLGVAASLFMLFKHPISGYFLAGALIGLVTVKWGERIQLSTVQIQLFELISLTLIIILASTERFYLWRNIFADTDIVVLFSATIVYFCTLLSDSSLSGRLLSSRPFIMLGTVSYTLYLAHPYSYLMSRKIVALNTFATDHALLHMTFFVLLTLFSTALLVWAVHKFVEVRLYQHFTGKLIVGARK